MNITSQLTKNLFVKKCFVSGCQFFLIGLFLSCSNSVSRYDENKREPQITPDYSGVTIPPNIAPLNFTINEKADKFQVKIYPLNDDTLVITSNSKNISIPAGKWKELLNQRKGKEFFIEVLARQEDHWIKFLPVVNHVAIDSIDSYLVYRLIDPVFKLWNNMGIYQRCLENFDETPIMINEMGKGNCMNCHSFSGNDSHTMMFHMRGKIAGTIFYRNGKISKVNTKTSQTISAGVYPAWHPNKRYLAFSVNNIIQQFHAVPDKKVEVIDTLSDLILYDCEKNMISNCPEIASKERFETFPTWSPDGRYLYFCSARAIPITRYNQIKYDLLRITFDPETRQFGKTDTVVSSTKMGLSVSFPRISPDGKYVLFCMSAYGNFTIWHSDSDLYLMNLETNEIVKPDINSSLTESYHTWSSSGRWIVFSSRRIDGLFTRPFFAYFDSTGKTRKPFVLPQKNPGFYETFLKSYNVPELVTSKVDLDPRDVSKIIKSELINASFESK